jgi:hypothetical protein
MSAAIQWQSPHLFWLTMLALAAALTAVVWFYRPQVKPLPRRWWWLLLGLRSFALAVLAVSILRPTVLRAVRLEQRGLIAVLVDQSASMGVVDAARAPPQLVALAAALGEISGELRPPALQQLRRDVGQLRQSVDEVARGSSEREYARLAGRGIEAAEAHLRQAQQNFASAVQTLLGSARGSPQTAPLAEVLSSLAAEPVEPPDSWERAVSERIDQLVERIDSMQIEADQRLYQTNETVRATCDALAGLPRIELARRALIGDSGGLVARLGADRPLRIFGFADELHTLQLPLDDVRAEGLFTDLAGALRDVRHGLASQRVAGAVVFTDGRQVPPEPALTATWPEVPVIAVNVAAPVTRDLSVARVALPASSFVGETITARIDLSGAGFDGSTVEVVVAADQQRIARAVRIDSGAARLEVPLKLDRPGPVDVEISVAPQAGEATRRNNTVSRSVKVISEKIRVALIAGVATWDYQHLRAALTHSPRFNVIDFLIDDGQSGPGAAQILEQDVIILCELPARSLDSAQWDAISRLVEEQAGSVVLIAGDPSIAASYGAQPLTAALLPWRGGTQPAWRIWRGEDPMFRVTPVAADLPEQIKLSDDIDTSRAMFNELPGIYRFVSMPPLKPVARALLVDRDSGSPVLTETRVGAGRSLMLGINEVWRWRATLPGSEIDRIWTQLIRFAAHQPYAVSEGNLRLDADRLHLEPGEPLRVRARVRSQPESGPDAPDDPPTLQLTRGGSVLRSEQLGSPIAGSTDRYETVIPELGAGDHELRLVADTHVVALPIHVAPTDETEMRDISPDPSHLRRVVGPRGDVLDLADLRDLPRRFQESTAPEPMYRELRLWDSPYLFLLVLGCLGVEWAVRKRVGLA